jgi:hypothetical protein
MPQTQVLSNSIPTIREEHIDHSWIVTTWSDGMKTVSPVDSERFIKDSQNLPVVGFRSPRIESPLVGSDASSHTDDNAR